MLTLVTLAYFLRIPFITIVNVTDRCQTSHIRFRKSMALVYKYNIEETSDGYINTPNSG